MKPPRAYTPHSQTREVSPVYCWKYLFTRVNWRGGRHTIFL